MLIKFSMILFIRYLIKTKEELENKDNITDKEDLKYAYICDILKIFDDKFLEEIKEK